MVVLIRVLSTFKRVATVVLSRRQTGPCIHPQVMCSEGAVQLEPRFYTLLRRYSSFVSAVLSALWPPIRGKTCSDRISFDAVRCRGHEADAPIAWIPRLPIWLTEPYRVWDHRAP